jgi:hypothetical protein
MAIEFESSTMGVLTGLREPLQVRAGDAWDLHQGPCTGSVHFSSPDVVRGIVAVSVRPVSVLTVVFDVSLRIIRSHGGKQMSRAHDLIEIDAGLADETVTGIIYRNIRELIEWKGRGARGQRHEF